MSIQFKHTAITLLFTLAFSAPAFSLDTSDIQDEMSSTKSSIKEKLGEKLSEKLDKKLDITSYDDEISSKGMMKRIDTDDDHMVSSAEYMNYLGEIFDTLDANTDNAIDEKEWAGNKANKLIKISTESYSRKLRRISTMQTMDTDKDHIVDRDEFVDFHQAILEQMDKKGSGIKY